jgi:uncharacterized integral membrane protein (TIGR00698 family)
LILTKVSFHNSAGEEPVDPKNNIILPRIVFCAAALACLLPLVPAWGALLLGIAVALTCGNPFLSLTRKHTHTLLGLSVMGLGAGMDLHVIGRVGLAGVGYTFAGIALTLALGTLLGRIFKADAETSLLVSVGTAICGGSAIAAVSPVIQAKPSNITVALATVFLLNAGALVLFPYIGHALSLSQTEFGLWAALAIHDTSSVVGATLAYGSEALQVGTTVKLARALWIVPLALCVGLAKGRKKDPANPVKTKRPWFILWFLMAAALVTWIPQLRDVGHGVAAVARRALVVTLFLIGSGLTRETLKSVGFRPLAQGVVLWVIVSSISLAVIMSGWVHL